MIEAIKPGTFRLIRVDGTDTLEERPPTTETVSTALGAHVLDVVILSYRHGQADTVMLVDDSGILLGLPVNQKATEIYRSVYPKSPNLIHGDVAIVNDGDF